MCCVLLCVYEMHLCCLFPIAAIICFANHHYQRICVWILRVINGIQSTKFIAFFSGMRFIDTKLDYYLKFLSRSLRLRGQRGKTSVGTGSSGGLNGLIRYLHTDPSTCRHNASMKFVEKKLDTAYFSSFTDRIPRRPGTCRG